MENKQEQSYYYVKVTFSPKGKEYTYKTTKVHQAGDLLVVGTQGDLQIVTAVEHTTKPSFKCKAILGEVKLYKDL